MRKLFRIFLCVCILNPFLLTACWNYKDIDELTIAAGMAIDKTSQGKYLVTIEIVHIEAKGQEGVKKSELIEVEGESLFDAIRNAISVNPHKIFWPHTKIVIFSRKWLVKALLALLIFFIVMASQGKQCTFLSLRVKLQRRYSIQKLLAGRLNLLILNKC